MENDCEARASLTAKQQKFCLLFFEKGNGGQSYWAAGYKVKSLATAQANASRLLRNAKVQEFLEWLRQQAIDKSIMQVTERKQRLTEIGRARITDFVDATGGVARIKVGLDSLNSGAVQEVTTDEVKLGKGDSALTADVTKLKLHDPVRAIDLLNKMDGIYDDSPKVNIDNRKIEVYVRSEEAKKLTDRILSGQGTG